jgi:hypothetical protein
LLLSSALFSARFSLSPPDDEDDDDDDEDGPGGLAVVPFRLERAPERESVL